QAARSTPRVSRRSLPAERPERRERVVRHLAGPDEVPQRIEYLAVRPAAGGRVQLAIERCAAGRQVLPQSLVTRLRRAVCPVRTRRPRAPDLPPPPDPHDT